MANVDQIHFGRVPSAMLSSGVVARLTGGEAKAYLVLAGHVNSQGWACRPSLGRIAHLVGVSERQARRLIRGLVEHGLVTITGKGGRALANTYTLATNPDIQDVRVSDPESTENPDILSTKPGHPEHQTRTSEHRNPDTQDVRPIEEQRNRAAEGPAAAAAGPSPVDPEDPLRSALLAAGIAEPSLTELAGLDGLTPETVRRASDRLKSTGKGVGALVLELRAAPARARAVASRAADPRPARAPRPAPEPPIADAVAASAAALAGLPAAELGRLKETTLDALGPAVRRQFAAADPRTCDPLRLLIAAQQARGGRR
jgi:DNA-binding Lrp family transcriptional regulator